VHKILQPVFHFFWHHSKIDKAKVQNFKICKINFKFSYINEFYRTALSLKAAPFHSTFSAKIALFHSAYSPKMQNSTACLNMLYTAKAHRFTARFWRKRLVSPRFFAQNAQYDPKTRSYEDNA
jgi:hypothetical protein